MIMFCTRDLRNLCLLQHRGMHIVPEELGGSSPLQARADPRKAGHSLRSLMTMGMKLLEQQRPDDNASPLVMVIVL